MKSKKNRIKVKNKMKENRTRFRNALNSSNNNYVTQIQLKVVFLSIKDVLKILKIAPKA